MARSRKRFYAAILIIMVITISLAVLSIRSNQNFWSNLTSSVITSLLASAIFALISEFALSKENYVEILDKKFDDFNEINKSGIVSIKRKDLYDDNFWVNIINNADSRIDLMGHSINAWFDKPYRNEFEKKLKELARKNKTVNLVIGKPDGACSQLLNSQLGIDISGKAKDTKEAIEKIKQQIPPKYRPFIKLYITDVVIPYMYIANDQYVYISPYMTKSDSSHSILLEFKRESEYAARFIEDFQKLLNSLEKQSPN